MNAPQSIASRRAPRKAFTLVELLVVIVIIGILTAILVPTIGGLIRTSEEFGINNEIQQLDAAVENFHSEFGFYPPDFSESTFRDVSGDPIPYNAAIEARLLQFLAKISPTHQELTADPIHTSESRLEHWWEVVGMQLVANSTGTTPEEKLRGPRVALWFWLTQLNNDAQYPLSGQRDPGNLDRNISERKTFFDFKGKQLNVLEVVDYATIAPNQVSGNYGEYAIYEVLQSSGFDTPIIYMHHETYPTALIDFAPGATVPNLARACEEYPLGAPITYFNSSSYQIFTAGYDESFGNVSATVNPPFENRDNICNFSEGRLDAFFELD